MGENVSDICPVHRELGRDSRLSESLNKNCLSFACWNAHPIKITVEMVLKVDFLGEYS